MSIQSEDLKGIDSVVFNSGTPDAIKTVKLNNDIIWTKFKLKGKFVDGSFYFFKNMQLHLYKHTDDTGAPSLTYQDKSIYIDENGFMSAPWINSEGVVGSEDASWEEKVDVPYNNRNFDFLMVEGYTYSANMNTPAHHASIAADLLYNAVNADDAVAMLRHIVLLDNIPNEMVYINSYTGKYGDYYRGASADFPSDSLQANDAVAVLRKIVAIDMEGTFYIDNSVVDEYVLKVCGDINNSGLFKDTSPFKGAVDV